LASTWIVSLPHEYQFNLDIPAGQEALDRMLTIVDVSVHRERTRMDGFTQ
jgi:hypothetical protein